MTDQSPDPSGFPAVPDPDRPPSPPDAPPAPFGQTPPPPGAQPHPYGQTPPPPGGQPHPYGQTPPPPGGQPHPYGQTPPPPGMAVPYAAPGFAAAPVTESGPRPRTPVGGALMIAGAVVALIGVFLPWATRRSRSFNGMDTFSWLDGFTFYSVDAPGAFAIAGAAVMLGLGIATLAAGRVLAVAIIGIISGALGVLGGLIMLGMVASFADNENASLAVGVILQPIAPIASLAGAIVVTATRRRPA